MDERTRELHARAREGDPGAVDLLFAGSAERVLLFVRSRLGAGLRGKAGVFGLPWLFSPQRIRPGYHLSYGASAALLWSAVAWGLIGGESIRLSGDWLWIPVALAACATIWAVAHLVEFAFRSSRA